MTGTGIPISRAAKSPSWKAIRKRATPSDNFKALEVARALGFTVAINIIADSGWDEDRFRIVREWAAGVPEIVHLTVNTPYPGTETWHTESRKLTSLDYRLFDVQHAVLPTTLPLHTAAFRRLLAVFLLGTTIATNSFWPWASALTSLWLGVVCHELDIRRKAKP